MSYSTQELIEFLEQELRATSQGKRVIFSASEKIDNPVISKAIDIEKAGRVFIYRDFRREIHQYQQDNQVSGIVWREIKFNDKSLRFPELHNQLIEIEGDKEILLASKKSVLDFWQEVTTEMKFYLSENRLNPLSKKSLELLYQQTEWAEIDVGKEEIYLGLCWGNPTQYIYKWAKPDSGCHRIIATKNQPSDINI